MIRTTDPRQCDLAGTAPDPAGIARKLASGPLRASKAQIPCDHGMFSDDAAQLDLEETGLWR